MKIQPNRLAAALLVAFVAPATQAAVPVGTFGGSEISFEGLVQADSNWYDSDLLDLDSDPGDGSDHDHELRRAQLVLKGKGPGDFDWVVGYDAKSDKWLDVNVGFGFDGGHSLQVGQFKQPNSMEELSSTKNNDFISKAMTTNTFAVSRRLGAAYAYTADDWTLTASSFGRELTSGGAHGSGYGVRGTFAPINDGGNILHFGLSYVDHDTDADTLRLRTRPQADLAGVRLVDTGTLLDTDRIATTGIESFWARGPFKLQGEYMLADVSRHDNADYSATGGYLSAIYNVTGEGWSYKGGTPGTAKPENPARGMWQLGLRYDTIDLDDGSVEGGQMDALTAGVNWYWQKNFKLAVNYVQVDSERQGASDDPDIVEARLQFFW
ncbi:OprO/OprP family phosphate-selective porin [Novilysobacter spongiicola]|uniref:Phosphate-selective porin OprO and OprP n=1 Tax=Lysobacter spongiicola DSM 21749 TaxID=1122188 RepID=A0A1T4MX59_9GAMM|nr:OprO/OprP family phosphate-selective porin [Lysobacter spongiicola]SJZ71365.1 phosphate-selective porin OprO and OprP [Lysobacter spongiicola DSM 21749]